VSFMIRCSSTNLLNPLNMEPKHFLRYSALLLSAIALNPIHAQLVQGPLGSRYMQPTNTGQNNTWTRSFGVGYFNTNMAFPASFLHVNTLTGYALLPSNNSIANFGEVFRTTGLGTVSNFWRMYHGGSAAGFERGQLFAEFGNPNFNINAPNGELRLFTSTARRMNILPTIAPQTVNGYPGINLSGNVGVGPFTNPIVTQPLSLLHLNRGGTEVAGYRPWMQAGTTMTQASDWMYVGLMQSNIFVPDRTDAVINWADNNEINPQDGPDALRFIFTREPTLSGTAAAVNGLELARMIPDTSGNEGFVGIGDFAAPGLQPNERLDVLNRTIRLRRLIPDYNNDTLSRVVMVDTSGRLRWRRISTWPSGCDWELSPGNFTMNTAWREAGSTSNCPDARWKLSIGSGNVPGFKLEVHHSSLVSAADGGIRVVFKGANGTFPTGISSEVEPTNASLFNGYGAFHRLRGVTNGGHGSYSQISLDVAGAVPSLAIGSAGFVLASEGITDKAIGCSGKVQTASNGKIVTSYGLKGEATGTPLSVTNNFGVHGKAEAGVGANNYSIYGTSPGSGSYDWSGYFEGRTFVGGTIFFPSDENLKTGIEDLGDATTLLLQLRPKSYTYRTEEFPQLGLANGVRYGFLAQEVGKVFPQWVTPVHQPEQYDTSGVMVSEAVDFIALSTSDIIPILVGAFQDQHISSSTLNAMVSGQAAEVEALRYLVQEQRTRLDQFAELLAACCANSNGAGARDASGLSADPVLDPALDPARDSQLRIVPNPFSEPPTVYYTLERSGRMQLIANSSDGKALQVLQEASMEAGSYQFNWNTAELAPGMYYVTLLLDGQPLVKKAVKVTR